VAGDGLWRFRASAVDQIRGSARQRENENTGKSQCYEKGFVPHGNLPGGKKYPKQSRRAGLVTENFIIHNGCVAGVHRESRSADLRGRNFFPFKWIDGHKEMTFRRVDNSLAGHRLNPEMVCAGMWVGAPGRRRASHFIRVATLFLFASLPFSALAQSGLADDPHVQHLYAAAKSAEAQGDFSGAEAKYESILKIAPRLGAAYNNLGALYMKQGEYQKAAAILEQGLKIESKMSSASALLGMAQYEMGDYAAARVSLQAALRANPKDTNAEMYLANALIRVGDLEGGAKHLEQVTRREPNNQEAWYRLGKVYVQLAEHAIVQVNQIDRNSVVVHQLSGEIMESMQNYDGALVEYKKAVDMAPDRPGTHLRLGNAYWALAMWDPATEQFQAELHNDPRSCEARWKLGNILVEEQSNYEQAVTETDKALALCPDLREAHVDRARALIKLGRNEEAVRDLTFAETADPSVSSTHFLLAQAYRALGRTKEAQAEMQLFSKLEESSRAASAERLREVLQNKEPPH